MKQYIQVVTLVFRQIRYVELGVLVVLLMVSMKNILFRWGLIVTISTSDLFDFLEKIRLLFIMAFRIGASQTVVDSVIFFTIAIAVGLNIPLLVFYFHQRLRITLASGTSVLGVILSLVGVGCASCGSIIITSIIGLSAVSTYLAFLPFGGTELGILSLVLLLFSIVLVLRKLQKIGVCDV